MSTYMKQLCSHLAVQPQSTAVPHVAVQLVPFCATSQKTPLFRRPEPAEDGFPAACGH